MSTRLQDLRNRLTNIPQESLPMHSRIHPLQSFVFPDCKCYVKRDDELGFGISGSKVRKYRTLIPFFCKQGFREIVVIGSAFSNHVLSLIQLLIENEIQPTLFLRGDPDRLFQGNLLLSSLFVSASSIHWFSKADWHTVQSQAHAYAQKQQHPTFVLPEGGSIPAALPGALTLPLDVQDNEREHGLHFDHIFIEAGTGFMASALILGLAWLERATTVHTVLLAEDRAKFLSQLGSCHETFMQIMQTPCPFPQNFVVHDPHLTGSFGQIKPDLFEAITYIAQKEGFLTDPIYSVKLFLESRHLLNCGEICGNILILHSGGALTLMGFQEQIKTALFCFKSDF